MVRKGVDRWVPCPEGELDRLEALVRRGRLRHALATLCAALAASVSVAVAGWVVADAVRPTWTQTYWPECYESERFSRPVPISAPLKPRVD